MFTDLYARIHAQHRREKNSDSFERHVYFIPVTISHYFFFKKMNRLSKIFRPIETTISRKEHALSSRSQIVDNLFAF